MNKKILLLSFPILFVSFQNFTIPEFPSRNIDTVVFKKTDGEYKPTTPYLPITEFSFDGRIGLLRKPGPRGAAKLFTLKPEGRVHEHFKHEANPLVGANLIDQSPHVLYKPDLAFSARFKNSRIGANLIPHRTILCEKSEEQSNPYPCGENRDCYNLTFITRYQRVYERDSKEMRDIKLVASTARLTVINPKTSQARIERLDYLPGTEKVGPLHIYPKMAEPVVVGDGRLLITRIHNARVTLSDGRPSEPNINIVYSVYPGGEPQCDVSKWRQFHPISHANSDSRMNPKYKFARYPLRDSLGNEVPETHALGGSYPWMDKDAANLFFTSLGTDHFYSFHNDSVKTPFTEAPDSADYFTPILNTNFQDFNFEAGLVESRHARTAGIAMAGFWTHGKVVLLDGLLNNVDYNFRVANRNIAGTPINVTRKLKLYNNTPSNQYFEEVGANRELGSWVNGVEYNQYHPLIELNSTFLGSIENRLNYIDEMKPVTPRDVVWLFGSTRHTEEVAFDDYISPYLFINADMTAPVGFKSTYKLSFGLQFMRHFSGFVYGQKQSSSFFGDPRNAGSPALVQNAATAPSSFMKVPSYGKIRGPSRIEPIAKGGIYGKGLWLTPESAISFDVPLQPDTQFDISAHKSWYMGVFLDSRSKIKRDETRQFISWGNRFSIRLRKLHSGQHQYDRIALYDYETPIASKSLPNTLRILPKRWIHVGIQFNRNAIPSIFIDGMSTGSMAINKGASSQTVKNAFKMHPGDQIALGFNGGGISGIRGWVDEFKVIARSPNWEEKCNYARGTMIELGDNNPYWLAKAQAYPIGVQSALRGLLKEGNPDKKYACFVRYYGGTPLGETMRQHQHANLKNQPSGTRSIRESLNGTKNMLVFSQPRPDFSKNQFCTSCHVSPLKNPYKELNSLALVQLRGVKLQNDHRRQPMQPDNFIRGVIPAGYFGAGRPSRTLSSTGIKIDQWITPRLKQVQVKWNSPGPKYEYSLDVRVNGRSIAPCIHAGVLKKSSYYTFKGRCFDGDRSIVPMDSRTEIRICNNPSSQWKEGRASCSPYKKITEHDNGFLELFSEYK